jgi:hypothetical protein
MVLSKRSLGNCAPLTRWSVNACALRLTDRPVRGLSDLVAADEWLRCVNGLPDRLDGYRLPGRVLAPRAGGL